MKKLITLFSFLAFFSLIFIGCQSTENITAPEDLSKAGNVSTATLTWGDPVAGTLPYTVQLVAGQHNVVGTVKVERIGNDLKVTYALSGMGAGGTISDVHVDLTYDPANFNANKNGNPTFGNFDSKNFSSITYNADKSEAYVYFTAAQLVSALGSAPTTGQKIYIAAHSGVCYPSGMAAAEFCPELDLTAKFLSIPTFNQEINGVTYYFKGTLDKPLVTGGETILGGWCLDPHKTISSGEGGSLVNRVCYTDFQCIDQTILSKINWIINNRDASWTWKEVQDAIYKLLGDNSNPYSANQTIVSAILTAAADKGSWKPTECGQKVLIITFNGDGTCENITKQIVGWEVEVKCEYTCDTAMGFPFVNGAANDTYSKLFPGHVWFRYFAFSY